MKAKTAKFLLEKVLGWHMTPGEDKLPEEKRIIFLFAPHTSIWDAVVGYLYFCGIGGRLRVMIKKEAFFWPLGWLLRKCGAFPIDRSNPQSLMVSLIHELRDEQVCYLAICPEGTRKAVRKWKTGYHTIATETGMSVFLSHMDYRKKEVGYGKKFELTGNAREDTNRIQKAYGEMHLTALRPKGYTTE